MTNCPSLLWPDPISHRDVITCIVRAPREGHVRLPFPFAAKMKAGTLTKDQRIWLSTLTYLIITHVQVSIGNKKIFVMIM